MCGISGIFSKNKLTDTSIIESLQSIKHRGPNNTIHTSYFNEELHFFSSKLSDKETQSNLINSKSIISNNWIGFNRLSILDLSNNGMQPFYDKKTNTSFLLNGEIYNFKELKEKYLKNIQFNSDSDTEVIFNLYLKLGDDFIQHLRGMFIIVVIDYNKHKIKIWRDRFGIKPLYYFLDKENFIFSSEIKGIFTTELVNKKINYKHLAYSMYLNTSFSPYTIYDHINSLEPATKITIDFSTFKIEKEIYWQLEYNEDSKKISKDEFLNDIKEITKLASVSDVKQAIMLSGGLDSGLLAYQFHQNNIDIDAITIFNSEVNEQNELEFARINAKNANIKIIEYEINNEVNIQTIKKYCLAEDEPNVSPEPAYFLAKKAHDNEYVILQNALGLDELFYGYNYYNQAKKLNILKPFLFKNFKYLLKGSKRYKYEEITNYGLETLPFISRTISSWEEIKKLFYQFDSKEWEHPISMIMKQIKINNSKFNSFPLLKKISYLDFYYYISSHHSNRSDISAMHFEIEMRFPYLDHLFVQKYFNNNRLDNQLTKNNNKPFLRENVKNILPVKILKMPKKGFSMPTEKWLKNIDLEKDFPEIKEYFGNDYQHWANTPERKWNLLSSVLLINRL